MSSAGNTRSVTSLRRGPPLPSKPEYKARLLRASPRRCADDLRIIEAQVTSPHTHTRGTHRSHPRGCRLPYTKHLLSRHTGIGWSGGGGGSGTRGRTGSDGAEQRPPGRPLLRSATSAPSAQLERGQAQGSVAARGSAAAVASRRAARARRGGQVIGRRVMGRIVTAASDRRRRADRCSAAADLEGVRSATVGVGGRPSCGEEGGRQVRVVRVALHRAVER